MPTYLNSSTGVIYLNQHPIESGKTLVTQCPIVTALPTGVTLTSVLPIYDPVVSSNYVTGTSGSTTVTVPLTFGGAPLEHYRIRVYCSVGRIQVKLNDSTATALNVLAGETIEYDCSMWPLISIVIVAIMDSATGNFVVDVIAV